MIKKLLSLSDDPYSLARFDGKPEGVYAALAENGFDSIELMRWHDPQALPGVRIVGRHMPYWPVWLDFWRGDRPSLMRQFGSEENVRLYYSASSREEFVRMRRAELHDAAAMGAEYAVFHVSHVELEHCCNGRFTYTDEEIVHAFIDLINEAADGLDCGMALLFENHWYPGLKLTNRALAETLMTQVRYPHKGFVLDISHMMLTHDAKTEPEAVDMILKNLHSLGEMAAHIKAVHLNSAAGAQPLDMDFEPDADFEARLLAAMRYVGSLDPHHPFLYEGIRQVLDATQPEFLVFELSFRTRQELKRIVGQQNRVLNNAKNAF
jgi:sugar phosphate isomerase/epimerase